MIEYSNFTYPWEIMTYMNTITYGWFAPVLLVVIWMCTFLALGNLRPGQAFSGATYLTAVLTVVLFFLGVANSFLLTIVLLFLLGAIIFAR